LIDAGPFGKWLASMRAVLRGEGDADVPCGSCVGCCVSSYPIPLRVEDEVARDLVPEQWLVGSSKPGERWLMAFREDGSCPFLSTQGCGIYADRPRTCRDYDCRIYAAAGILPDGERPLIQQRVRDWEFDFESPDARRQALAVVRAATFIRENPGLFPVSMRAQSATAAAVMAVKGFELFLSDQSLERPELVAQRLVAACAAFDSAAIASEQSPTPPG
jgi:uncharacterized protein